MKRIAAIVLVSAVHFALCGLVNAAVLSSTAANVLETGRPFSAALMLWLSKALYFPLLSLPLYSRNWFPGDLILIVMATNSLLWGTGLVLGAAAAKKICTRSLQRPQRPLR